MWISEFRTGLLQYLLVLSVHTMDRIDIKATNLDQQFTCIPTRNLFHINVFHTSFYFPYNSIWCLWHFMTCAVLTHGKTRQHKHRFVVVVVVLLCNYVVPFPNAVQWRKDVIVLVFRKRIKKKHKLISEIQNFGYYSYMKKIWFFSKLYLLRPTP